MSQAHILNLNDSVLSYRKLLRFYSCRLGILLRKLPSRSLDEIRFRLRQELTNLRFSAFPPHLPATALESRQDRFHILPNPAFVADRLKTTPFAAECVRLAEEILQHRFPVLGVTLETGQDIRWRRDYVSGIETGTVYFRRIPYLDAARAGDHKTIWEINRHQHLVLLAQAYLFSGREAFLDEIVCQLESWFAQNPFQRSINWASALEVAFRALSWIWVHHLVGGHFSKAFQHRFLEGLYRHGLHLEVNLSYYFAPNTHLLGEAVALHALGNLFPQFPHAARWEKLGARVVRNELNRQVLADGCHFELSTYYHLYALDMFLFHAVLRTHSFDADVYTDKLTRMAAFLDAILGPFGTLPLIGDDDGGRFFHPYGPRNQFALATLATSGAFLNHPEWIRNPRYLDEQAAWWLDLASGGQPGCAAAVKSARFRDCGLIVMAAQDVQLITDTGSFGPGRAGHSHADTLSLVVRRGQEEILIDPGTYTYVADPVWRDRFRGTAAHNTVRLDGLDQAIPGGPFAWQSRPVVEVLGWETSAAMDILTAACSYSGLRHQRKIIFDKSDLWIVVLDLLEGAPEGQAGQHRIEQFWHFGAEVQQPLPRCFQVGTKALVAFEAGVEPRLFEGGDYGWISPALGVKLPAPVVCIEQQVPLPASLATMIDLSGKARTLSFRLHSNRLGADCVYDGQPPVTLLWN